MLDRGRFFGRTTPGAVVILLAASFLALGVWHAYGLLTDDAAPTRSSMAANERRIVDHLKTIQAAQNRFKDRHPRGEYARFTAHLWQWVDPRGNPVLLDLVPRRLAMAMGPTKAVDGYYLIEVRSRGGTDGATPSPMDYGRQWAVAAVPATFQKTGRLVFLADQTGRIFATAPPRPPTLYPRDPVAAGWRILDAGEDLLELQAGLGGE